MDPISISVEDVALFVATFILPAINGLLSSWLAEKWKVIVYLPETIRALAIRGFVAVFCVVLYVVEQGILTHSIVDASTLPTLFYSYVTAAAAFDHLFKRK